MITAVCRHVGVDKAELASRTRQIEITRVRAPIGYIATKELLISGSELARRFNIDRSSESRAARRAAHDPELMEAAKDSIYSLSNLNQQ